MKRSLLQLSTALRQLVQLSQTRRLAAKPLNPNKVKGKESQTKHFVDFRKVEVIGGDGGHGCVAFTSLPRKEWAGPDGGDGGNGGHVVFKASTNRKSLADLDPVIRAEGGVKGHARHCHGKNAEHLMVEVPVGTVVKDEDGKILSSLEASGEYFVAARGGAGGHGNNVFLSNENRAPAYAESGAQGQRRVLLVELKTMAHAGLIGFPNAGKSTLLRAISRARPKVASYPFTTLNPHVGMVMYDDFEQIAVADIPGLISGAHLNRGLGISFLRHIQRCTCLLYVLDLSVDEPWTQLHDLQFELDKYEEGLSRRPCAVVANKVDLPGANKNLQALQDQVTLPIFPVSARERVGIKPLLIHLRELYDTYAEKKGTGW
ncbi:mitochondrial ribosome-associated GTPase 2-like [Haliotis asinina]|uniref:mitochondrial ribosome-associated GTPase 2-like n=1 Tax=Haliotis asinina TaxID=109174 RepID=UPI0035320829